MPAGGDSVGPEDCVRWKALPFASEGRLPDYYKKNNHRKAGSRMSATEVLHRGVVPKL